MSMYIGKEVKNLRDDFSKIQSGQDPYDVLIEFWQMPDFIITKERRRDHRDSFFDNQDYYFRFYHPDKFSTWRSDSTVWPTFDQAILGALSTKYMGPNCDAGSLMSNMLRIDDADHQSWSY